MAEMGLVEVTWIRASKVWWSLFWRSLLFSFLAGAGVGIILGFFMGLARVNPATIKNVATIAGYIVSIPVGIAITKIVLQKKYSDFKIALIA